MSNNNVKKSCSSVAPALKASCESAARTCEKNKDENCGRALDFCSSNTAWPALLHTSKDSSARTYRASNPAICLGLVRIFSNGGHSFVRGEPEEKKAQPAPEKEESSEHKSNSAHPAPREGETPPPPADKPPVEAPTDIDTSVCDPMKGKQKEGCIDLVKECTQVESWPHTIETTGERHYSPASPASCMRLATILSGSNRFLLSTAERFKDKETNSPKPEKKTTQDRKQRTSTRKSTPTYDSDTASSNFTITKPFSDINLRLRVTGNRKVEEKRTLHFEGGKGLPLEIRYSVEKLSTGRYLMEYSLSRRGKAIGGDQSITFSAPNGVINLAFEIVLAKENDFSKIRSITIVPHTSR